MDPGYDLSQLLRDKRTADFGEGTSASREEAEVVCPYCQDELEDLSSLIEHVEDEHSYSQRPVCCPVCRRPTKNLVPHLLQHAHYLTGYASSSSQPSTSRATCHSMEWGRVTCCSELSFCTTIEDEQEGEGDHGVPADAESTLSATETKSMSGSEATDAALCVTELHGSLTAPPQQQALPPQEHVFSQQSAVCAGLAADRGGGEAKEKLAPGTCPRYSSEQRMMQRRDFVRQLLLSAFQLDTPSTSVALYKPR